jgi:hypothetical protein
MRPTEGLSDALEDRLCMHASVNLARAIAHVLRRLGRDLEPLEGLPCSWSMVTMVGHWDSSSENLRGHCGLGHEPHPTLGKGVSQHKQIVYIRYGPFEKALQLCPHKHYWNLSPYTIFNLLLHKGRSDLYKLLNRRLCKWRLFGCGSI